MKIRIWGARGSIPTPIRPDDISQKLYQAIKGMPDINTDDGEAVQAYVDGLPPLLRGTAGGNTSSVEIQVGTETFIIDAGSGIRELGLELMKGPCGQGEGRLHLFFSHPHWDHIQGFPFFIPAFIPGNHITLYSIHDLRTALEEQQNPINFPVPLSIMQADMEFVTLKPGQPFQVGDVHINTIENAHPGRSYGYRFQDQHSVFVYASDSEYKQLDDNNYQAHIDFFRDADALIFDAQYTLREGWVKVDWGHSSAMIGVDMARAAGVKRLLLAHHDPTYSDSKLQSILEDARAYQEEEPTLPNVELFIAYEGLSLDLAPPGAVSVDKQSHEQAAILSPAGVFGAHGVRQLQQHLTELAEGSPNSYPIIDLSQVETLTTTELKALVDLNEAVNESDLILVAPSVKVHDVIELGGFADDFPIYPTIADAVAALETRQALHLPGYLLQDRFQIEALMGGSPLGSTLRAIDGQDQTQVVIKVIDPAFSEDARGNLLRHSPRLTNLNHASVISIRTVADTDGFSFVVEDYVEGVTLEEYLATSGDGIPLDRALSIGQDIAKALVAAHSQGVVHGDLTPANVFMIEHGVRVGGFGLGRLDEGRQRLEAPVLHQSAQYLAPEQILGQSLDARVDLYALGVILYQLFAGQPPFQGSDRDVLQAHLSHKPCSPRELNERITPTLDHLILKLLAKNPSDRYANAWQVSQLLTNLAAGDAESVPWRRLQLVGREASLQALGSLWEEARSGQGRLAFVTGEEGIGKTSFIEQVAANSDAPLILIGACSGREGSPAYQPWREILESYIETVPPELFDSELQFPLGVVANLVPFLRQAIPDLPNPPVLNPRQAQLRLLDSVRQVIGHATKDRPWLIVLEDLHWIDPGSADLLRHLGFHLPDMALMLIGTYRDTEINAQHHLSKALLSLNTHPTYHLFPLDRLDASHVRAVLATIWDDSVPTSLVQQIYEHTEGNPFYVHEIASGLGDEGIVTWQDGRWRFPDLTTLKLPDTVQEAVRRRLRQLHEDTQLLLSQAAVLGQSFTLNQLVAVSGLSDWDILERLDVALERRLIEESEETSALQFGHAEIQEVIYGDLSPLRRRRYHHEVGIALERLAQPDPKQQAGVLAQHFYLAEDLDKGPGYCFAAGEMAEAVYANEEAMLWFQRTLDLLASKEDRGGDDLDLKMSAHLRLGQVLVLRGQYAEALDQFEFSRQAVLSSPNAKDYQNTLLDLYRRTSKVHELVGEYEIALDWLERGHQYLDGSKPSVELVDFLLMKGWLYGRLDRIEPAIEWCEQSLKTASLLPAPEEERHTAEVLYNLAAVYLKLDAYDLAIQHCKESIDNYRNLGDEVGEAHASMNLAAAYGYQGKLQECNEINGKCLAQFVRVGDIDSWLTISGNIGQYYLEIGDLSRAKECIEQCIRLAEDIDSNSQEAANGLRLAEWHVRQQGWSAARKVLVECQTMIDGIRSSELSSEADWLWTEVLLGEHDVEQAHVYAQRALETCESASSRWGQGISLRLLGQVFDAKGETERAETMFRASLRILEGLGSKLDAARTQVSLARLLLRSGDHAQASGLLAEAREVFCDVGAVPDLAEVEALMVSVDDTVN